MKEIKSVRVRRNDVNVGTLDIKVTIYEENRTFAADERILIGFNNDRPVWIATTYKKTASYKNFTDDQFINDFVNMNSKIEGKPYYIIQDPWEVKVPLYRNFGSDPYYLNNGAVIYIIWKDGNTEVGGQKYSDDKGNELPITTLYVDKTIKIISSNETQGFTLGKNSKFEYGTDSQVYTSSIEDNNILSEIILQWKIKIPDYNLALCSPNNESCSIIPYKSPLQPIVPDVPATPVVETPISADSKKKESIKINLQNEIIKVKEDVLSLKVYIGVTKDVPLEKPLEHETLNTEQDDFIDGEGSEYIEEGFIGEEEKWEPLKDVENDTFDPDTDKGATGPGETPDTPAPPSYVPASQTQKEFIKNAVQATLSKGSGKGLCGRFTFNHANNYVRLMQGKPVEQGTTHPAGGNAKESGYHKNLQNLGYKKTDYGNMSKSALINKIKTNGWSVGDVIVYWCTDGPSNESHVKYGHTQIFTNSYHNTSGYRWSTDVINNFGERGGGEFIYNSKTGNSWNLIYLQAPKTKKLNDVA